MRALWIGALALTASAVGAAPHGLTVDMTPSQFQLGRGAVSCRVRGPDAATLQAVILDSRDRAVAAPVSQQAGVLQWDGHDKEGRLVPPGTYIVEIVEEPYLWDGAVVVTP